MAEFEVLPIWTGNLIADTMGFDDAEFGAYMRILIAMWRNGGRLPHDSQALRRVAGTTVHRWPRVEQRIMPKFIIASGEVSQKRLTDVMQRSRKVKWLRARASDKKNNSRTRKNLHLVVANPLK